MSTVVLAELAGRACPIAASLELVGVVRRTAYQQGPPRFEYHLTESGRALFPVLDALAAWGLDHAVSPDDPNRPDGRPRDTSVEIKVNYLRAVRLSSGR